MSSVNPDKNWRTRHIDALLGPRVEQLHNERGFTRADIARRLGVSDATLQNVEDGTARMTASQLWQICSISGVEIADVFAGLPTQIFKSKKDYERFRDLKRHAATTSDPDDGASNVGRGPGLGEPDWETELEPAPRADVAALAKAARRLSPEEVEYLIKSAKGLRR